jgi:hypothetical protein
MKPFVRSVAMSHPAEIHPSEIHPLMRQPSQAGTPVRASRISLTAMGVLSLAASLALPAQALAQMVPQASHAWRQMTGQGDTTTVRIDLRTESIAAGDDTPGRGLNLRGKGFWPQWEGRIGIVMDRQVNPLKDSFVLAQPMPSGLRMRSFHMLSDYYVDGGFRATAGILRGDTGQAWWSSGDNGGGLNLSVQRLDTLGLLGQTGSRDQQTMPYLGAGFTSGVGIWGLSSAWRFNADLGLVGVRNGALDNVSRTLQGDKSLDDLVRDLRLRPLIKVSVGYSF